MNNMKMFIIYDKLYEEYQIPFCMKNINIAKIEFNKFVENHINNTPDKDKPKEANRFNLFFFPEIEFDRENCKIVVNAQNKTGTEEYGAIGIATDMSANINNGENDE